MAVYPYTPDDSALVHARVAQFAEQTERYLAGHIDEERFRPLRLQNGLYIQRHAPMLRVSIPYGTLDARQLTRLATSQTRTIAVMSTLRPVKTSSSTGSH